MLRAIVDRLIVALALVLGVDLPQGGDTAVAVALVVLAIVDAYLRRRDAGLDRVLGRAQEIISQRMAAGASVSQEMRRLDECIDCMRKNGDA